MIKDVEPFTPSRFIANPHDPYQDPAWRWQRAGYLVDQGRQPLDDDDASTRLIWRFRQGQGEDFAANVGGLPAAELAAMTSAYELHRGPSLQRWEVQARLLANQTDADIALACDLTPMAVQAYHDAFYAVRPHLSFHLYIHFHVIGYQPCPPPAPDDHETILKLFAYNLGPLAIDAMLDLIREPPIMPECLASLDLPALGRLRDKLAMQVHVLVVATKASGLPPDYWLRLQQQLAPACQDVGPPHDEMRLILEDLQTSLGRIQSLSELLPRLAA